MKAIKASVARALQIGSYVETSDNSGAKIIKITSVIGQKTKKGRHPEAAVSDLIMCAVKKGKPEMRKQVVYAVIIRQKKEYKRPNGMRIKFEDNSVVILKDEKGNPKGTMLKGPIAKEVVDRWPAIAKLASIIV
jgi:large subunit ribosomal protein L14